MIGYEMTAHGYKMTSNLLDYLTSKYNMQKKSKILTSFTGKEAADPLGIEYVDCAGVLGACDDGKADVAGTFKGLNIAVEELAVDSPVV